MTAWLGFVTSFPTVLVLSGFQLRL